MMRPHLLAALSLAALSSSLVLIEACADSEDNPGDETSASGTGGTGGAAGAGGGGGDGGGVNPIDTDCAALCDYLASIMCTAFPNCATDCPNMFNAPDECADEFAEMLSCWVGHKTEFTCTATQVLPPEACQDQEEAFNACVGGVMTGEYPCMGQVGGGDGVTTCAAKTGCEDYEFRTACANTNGSWICSCYDHQELLGTCTEPDETLKCDNYKGCCAPFFEAKYAAG